MRFIVEKFALFSPQIEFLSSLTFIHKIFYTIKFMKLIFDFIFNIKIIRILKH